MVSFLFLDDYWENQSKNKTKNKQKNNNNNQKQSICIAVEQLSARIMELVSESVLDQSYEKARECIKVLRKGCVVVSSSGFLGSRKDGGWTINPHSFSRTRNLIGLINFCTM